MMKQEDLVCSFEQSKQLAELGISCHCYFYFNPKGEMVECWMFDGDEDTFTPALTASELGLVLPPYTTFMYRQSVEKWEVQLIMKGVEKVEYSPVLAHAMCEMLIRLLKKGDFTKEEVNEALSGS